MTREISLVIGTAGHIDHGKTTLVKAITGVDCDRLREEKKRGITIELGFAPLKLDDGRVVSLVDVPGHERFIRQMVAGASGIDAVLLVVAADEGVMPQTREHLAILELLGVRSGIVAVTKIDRVEPEFTELAVDDIKSLLTGTFLENAPVIPVSAVSKQNIPQLLDAFKMLVDTVRPRPRKGALFLPIDRAFPVSGFGTVVTGTAHIGTIHPNDEIAVYPSGLSGRIRSVQVHGNAVEEGWAGQRIAASISGVSVEELSRGDVVCASNVYHNTRCFDVRLKLLGSAHEPLKHWQRVRLLIGTSDIIARISLLHRKFVDPGECVAAQLLTEEDAICASGQRFIIRFYSPLQTIGGGEVIFPHSQRPRGRDRYAYAELLDAMRNDAEDRLFTLLEIHGLLSVSDAAKLLQQRADDVTKVAGVLAKANKIVMLGESEKDVFLAAFDRFEQLRDGIKGLLKSYHAERPAERGMPLDELVIKSALHKFDMRPAKALLWTLSALGVVRVEDNRVCLADFISNNDEAYRGRAAALNEFCLQKGFQPPLISEAREAIGESEKGMNLLLAGMKDSGHITVVSGYLLVSEIEQRLLDILKGINGEITLAAVRDATNSSRKYILPLLEYFDSKGITKRVGEKRIFRGAQ